MGWGREIDIDNFVLKEKQKVHVKDLKNLTRDELIEKIVSLEDKLKQLEDSYQSPNGPETAGTWVYRPYWK